jgi:hypothetical protein
MLLSVASGFQQSCKNATKRLAQRCTTALLGLLLVAGFLLTGCSHNRHTYDPRLRKIDELLGAQLPPGTTRSRVQYFLNSRGYPLEDTGDKTVVRALVRHVDPDTLQPAAAHATFHFDASDKLTTYELEPAAAAPF